MQETVDDPVATQRKGKVIISKKNKQVLIPGAGRIPFAKKRKENERLQEVDKFRYPTQDHMKSLFRPSRRSLAEIEISGQTVSALNPTLSYRNKL